MLGAASAGVALLASCTGPAAGGVPDVEVPSPRATVSGAPGDPLSDPVDGVRIPADWEAKADVSVFLCRAPEAGGGGERCPDGEVTGAQRDAVNAQLRRMPFVAQVYYEGRADAYQRFLADKDNAGVVQYTTAAMVPESFRVRVTSPDTAEVIRTAVVSLPGVAAVVVLR